MLGSVPDTPTLCSPGPAFQSCELTAQPIAQVPVFQMISHRGQNCHQQPASGDMPLSQTRDLCQASPTWLPSGLHLIWLPEAHSDPVTPVTFELSGRSSAH